MAYTPELLLLLSFSCSTYLFPLTPAIQLHCGKISILCDPLARVTQLFAVFWGRFSHCQQGQDGTYAFSVVFPPACVHLLVFLGYRVKNAVRAITISLSKLPVTTINSSGALPQLGAFTCLINKKNYREAIRVVKRRVFRAPTQAR